MAEEKIAIQIEIDGVKESFKSLGDLKSSLKAAREEALKFESGSQGFTKAQNRISQLTDKINGLGDSMKINGTGVERLRQSFSLMSEAALSFDGDKFKTALTGVGQAMSAIPVFLLIEGLTYLVQNFDEVLAVAKSFTQEAKDQAKALAALNSEFNKISGNLEEINFLEERFIKNSEFATKIALEQAKRRGASEAELARIQIEGNDKKLAILRKAEENYRNQFLYAESQFQKIRGSQDEEAVKNARQVLADAEKQYKSSKDKVLDFERESSLNIEQERTASANRQREIQKKLSADRIKILQEEQAWQLQSEEYLKKLDADKIKREQQTAAENLRISDELNGTIFAQRIERQLAEDAALLAEQEAFNKAYLEGEKQQDTEALKSKEDLEKRVTEYKKQQEEARMQIVVGSINAAATLSEAYFQTQLNHAKGNAKAELEIRKKMFNVDKAFNIARAIQDGIRSVQAALTIPPPAGQILAGVNGVMAAANVAKIASTNFDAGGTGSVPNLTEAPRSTNVAVPSISAPAQSQLLGANGQPITQAEREQQIVKAYVVSTELTNKQKNSRRIAEQAKI